jgi:hypothetical protein
MSGHVGLGECVYCGEQRALTRDHVPPRCLFSKPRPHNLVTVDCCVDCNRELARHDEYFRIAITMGIDREKFPNENSDSVRAINSLARPASQGFARLLLQNYERNPSRITVDARRIEIVLNRIVRGLFYHHREKRLPRTLEFVCSLVDASLKTSSEGRERINRLDGSLTTIGPGVFRYAFEPFEPPDPYGTVWLMRFYDHRTFFCVTASG